MKNQSHIQIIDLTQQYRTKRAHKSANSNTDQRNQTQKHSKRENEENYRNPWKMISGKTNSRIINGFQKKERHKKACEICWELEIQTLEMRERERERERN